MRYQFIDKIKRLEKNKQMVIIKNLTVTEDYFEEHFIHFPVFPGALQIEMIAQTCGALIEISSNYNQFSILLMVEKMKFKKMLHPGDQLVVTVTVLSQHPESALFDAKVVVDGKVVTSGTLMVGISTRDNLGSKFAKTLDVLEDRYAFLLRDAEIMD
jgi:3-hydroxyacyl-[acyl-carrier-protein] dehydratase